MMRLRNAWACLLLLMVSSVAFAQAEMVTKACDIRYVNEHLYYHLGDEMNVVDIDVEWPSVVDSSVEAALQTYLCKELFGVEAADFGTGYSLFKARFGQPVREKFTSLPNPDKYCYVSIGLKELGHVPHRFISFSLDKVITPQKLSTQKADTTHTLFTYDLVNDKILLLGDVLNLSSLSPDNSNYELFTQLLLRNSDIPDNEEITFMRLTQACLADYGLHIEGVYGNDTQLFGFTSVVGVDEKSPFLTKQVRKVMRQKLAATPIEQVPTETELNGESVYAKVDSMPKYPGGVASMQQFLAQNVTYPATEEGRKVQGRVLLSVVVTKDGFLRDIRVEQSVSPLIDREAVRVMRLMPRWKPGTIAGKPVNARIKMPISFVLHP